MTSSAEDQQKDIFTLVEGVNIPTLFKACCQRPLEEHAQLLKAMEMRPDDVIVVAWAKAGTHWIWEVVSMLLAGKAEYEKRTKEFAMMEATKIENMDSLLSPRVFNSHLPMHLLPLQIKEKRLKVVHVYRNIKDVIVSGYFHFIQAPGFEKMTLEDIVNINVNPEDLGGNYLTYLQGMADYKKDNPDVPFFTMAFEDCKEDPEREIGRLAEFLGVQASAQLTADIAHTTSFQKMKEADKTKQQKADLPPFQMYRKGEVGDWKNYLTVAQSERLDAAMTQLKSRDDYHFRYTL